MKIRNRTWKIRKHTHIEKQRRRPTTALELIAKHVLPQSRRLILSMTIARRERERERERKDTSDKNFRKLSQPPARQRQPPDLIEFV